MLKLYKLQSKRLENLRTYDAIVTHSDHMLAELMKHGLSPQRAYSFPYYVQSAANTQEDQTNVVTSSALSLTRVAVASSVQREVKSELHLLFCGRMEYLKGAHVFIDALPEVSAKLERPLRVTFAGEGAERAALERRAGRVQRAGLKIEFAGWVERTQMEVLLKACDLLVVPSLWPEPFGLVGPEAGHFGVPVAAFDVGGIRDWLSDGVNGHLAPGTPPTAIGLAQAIIKCLRDPAAHARLRQGAFEVSQRFSIKNHLTALLEVFSDVSARH
jgi:glycosyltransferase involved in cell wall biosynthesis